MLIWKIAWRNLWRHRGKSLVIGVILFLGAFLMTIGNGLVDGAKEGMKQNLINRFAGHVILVSSSEKKNSIFFTNKSVKIVPDYPAVKQLLEQQEFVQDFLPMGRGMALFLSEGSADAAIDEEHVDMVVFGVNFDDYQRMFLNNIVSEEGRLFKNNEHGAIISTGMRERIFENQEYWMLPEGGEVVEASLTEDARKERAALKLKRDLVLLGIGGENLETDIRLPVTGIFKFNALNKALGGGVIFMDIESFRQCFGYVTAADKAVALTQAQTDALTAESEDDLFSGGDVVVESEATAAAYNLEAMQQETTRQKTTVNLDEGAFNLVSVKFKPGVSVEDGQQRLQAAIDAAGAKVKILTWQQSAGEIAQFATMTQGALHVFVLLIFFVAIIIIMNTLSMAAIERAAEIGMMRAIGARKGFISKMFFAETALLAFFFGGLGMLAGVLGIQIVNALRISTAGNEMLNLLFSADTVQPMASWWGLAFGVFEIGVVTLLAMIYPTRVATKITPLEAISRD